METVCLACSDTLPFWLRDKSPQRSRQEKPPQSAASGFSLLCGAIGSLMQEF